MKETVPKSEDWFLRRSWASGCKSEGQNGTKAELPEAKFKSHSTCNKRQSEAGTKPSQQHHKAYKLKRSRDINLKQKAPLQLLASLLKS